MTIPAETISQSNIKATLPPEAVAESGALHKNAAAFFENDKFELGLWLSGLKSFLNFRNHLLAESTTTKASNHNWSKELRLCYTRLLVCSRLAQSLSKTLKSQNTIRITSDTPENQDQLESIEIRGGMTYREMAQLCEFLRDTIRMCEAQLESSGYGLSEWLAFSRRVSQSLEELEIVNDLIQSAEKEGENFLPPVLKEALNKRPVISQPEADLRTLLGWFAKILRWLDVVSQFHAKDEPLKPTLLILTRVYEQAQEMIAFANNSLLRYKDQSSPIFDAIDCAIYASSIEIRRVFRSELSGITDIREAPMLYGRIETGHSLLYDSVQQTIAGFAKLIDPSIEATDLFPNIKTKLACSLILRKEVSQLLLTIRAMEADIETYPLDDLRKRLSEFRESGMRFLFYKDVETVERFIEEVLFTSNIEDLRSLLHRFDAYVETLLGQINMRTVLADHPYDPNAAD